MGHGYVTILYGIMLLCSIVDFLCKPVYLSQLGVWVTLTLSNIFV